MVSDDRGGEEHVLPHRLRHERHAVLSVELVILLKYVARRTTRPGIGHSLMPSFNTISRCSADEADQQPGNDEHVHREES